MDWIEKNGLCIHHICQCNPPDHHERHQIDATREAIDGAIHKKGYPGEKPESPVITLRMDDWEQLGEVLCLTTGGMGVSWQWRCQALIRRVKERNSVK